MTARCVATVACFSVMGWVAACSDAAIRNRGNTVLVIDQRGFASAEASLSLHPTLSQVYEFFGKPDRTFEGRGRVFVWDRLGIIMNYDPREEVVQWLQAYWQPCSFDHCPSRSFQGLIRIGDIEISDLSVRADLLASQGFSEGPHRWVVTRVGSQSVALLPSQNAETFASIEIAYRPNEPGEYLRYVPSESNGS